MPFTFDFGVYYRVEFPSEFRADQVAARVVLCVQPESRYEPLIDRKISIGHPSIYIALALALTLTVTVAVIPAALAGSLK